NAFAGPWFQKFEVYTIQGQLIKSIPFETSIMQLNVSSFEDGTYIDHLKHNGAVFYTNKIIHTK
ncbi:MAG: hypothetical protein K9G40_13205, partial [Crocinitomicaceae bacterium]|nr:hypothetical protein [Crocinitomicaceae bacterium]